MAESEEKGRDRVREKKRSFGVDDGVVSPFWYSVLRKLHRGQACTVLRSS